MLWFWCQAFAGGCQRTLEVSAQRSSVVARRLARAAVTGYDNDGRGRADVGRERHARSDFAVTGAAGRATLSRPSRAGRYVVSAASTGLVPLLPGDVVVR